MRRLVVLAVVVAAFFALALPALAQTDPGPVDGITVESLATVAGAVAASGIVVGFAGALFTLSSRAKRVLSAVVGLAVVVAATLIEGQYDFGVLILAVLTGMSAGLAASKAQEVGSDGLSHSVTRSAIDSG